MTHSVRITGGKATGYANSFVETARLRQERKAGRPLFPKVRGGGVRACVHVCVCG